jgi:Ca2+-transporting ATPase
MLVGASRGLSSAEAAARRSGGGRDRARESPWRALAAHLRTSLTARLVLLLVAAALIYAVAGDLRDAGVILAVIAVVVGVEAWTQWRASRAIASLTVLSAPRALVWRDRKLHEVAPEALVRDDVIMLSAGSRVPADARLIEAEELLVDESLVTGESQPVTHGVGAGEVAELKAGTHVLRGRGAAVVTAVGVDSTLGRVAGLVTESERQQTPLQARMTRLARRLMIAAIAGSVLVALVGLLRGQPVRDMVLSALTLAFATIPGELPVLVVIILGLGSVGLVRRGVIVRRLSAAEALGATTLVCTDKTGTLTQNRISLTAVVTAAEVVESRPGAPAQQDRVKRLARLACEPAAAGDSRLADPIDMAVFHATDADWPEPLARFSFDSDRRLASGLTQVYGELVLGVKGAPEAVLVRAARWRSTAGLEPLDSELKTQVAATAAELTAGGVRVLAVASRVLGDAVGAGPSALERELVFEGLLAFSDPLRAEVPGAGRDLQRAGVAVAMVTGDQPGTAAAIARSAGLGGPVFIAAQTKAWTDAELVQRMTSGCVVARARPEDKLRIVRAATEAGEIVAVTGDGINDAPALEAASIGVAMGRDGSDVAREAADVVLTDDSFATLARATAESRRLYENLRKAVRYYLAVKLALVAVTLVMALTGRPLPFSPVQIVILELFMDLGASVAFVNQAAETDEMRRRPRDPRARFLDRPMMIGIASGALTLAILTGVLYAAALPGLGVSGARTLALVGWLTGHAALGIAMSSERRPLVPRDLLGNPALLAWAAASIAFALAILLWQPLHALLSAGPVPAWTAVVALLAGCAGPLWLEGFKRWRQR